jgi:hypothetical protein
MNSIQEKALFHLTGKNDLSRVGEDILIKLADKYPYFAPVQMLLSAKLKESNSLEFIKQAQKTSLYFTNPYWLHYLLQEKPVKAEIIENSPSFIDYSWSGSKPIIRESNENVTEQLDPSFENHIAKTDNEFNSNISIPTIELVKEMMKGIDKQVLPESVMEEHFDVAIDHQPSNDESESGSMLANLEPYNEEIATDLSNSKISHLLSTQLADFKKPVKEEEELEIAKEPMHTIDYFASQGIKIDLSKIPQDKLTTHLRRFTDWLKYMKHDNPNPIDLGTNQDLEEAVEIIANTSNEQKEIVTETMADVLQKQGQLDKAIQLYIKLSFLNPEKSAYFASKIQHLKGIQ